MGFEPMLKGSHCKHSNHSVTEAHDVPAVLRPFNLNYKLKVKQNSKTIIGRNTTPNPDPNHIP